MGNKKRDLCRELNAVKVWKLSFKQIALLHCQCDILQHQQEQKKSCQSCEGAKHILQLKDSNSPSAVYSFNVIHYQMCA